MCYVQGVRRGCMWKKYGKSVNGLCDAVTEIIYKRLFSFTKL